MRNVELSEQELFDLRDEVCRHIEENVDDVLAERIGDAILDAMVGPDGKGTDELSTRKCFVNLAYAVATFLDALLEITNRTRPKDEQFKCEQFGEEFSDHLDAFCCVNDYKREYRAKMKESED